MATKKNSATKKAAKPLPKVKITGSYFKVDYATVLGLAFSIGIIIAAISLGQSNAKFFNTPSFLIVIIGTIAATAISFSSEELMKSGNIFRQAIFRNVQNPSQLAKSLVDIAVIAKKKGILALSKHEQEIRKDAFLFEAMQLVIDGYDQHAIETVLTQQVEALKERHKRSASITRRASEIAPAMGLIGTLVGLVQMLADLENPETIGPAMAIALLTTFYGAILGTVVMAPLAVKLEKRSNDEALLRTLIITAATSIARQDNPRRLEMLLNADLQPSDRINYFD